VIIRLPVKQGVGGQDDFKGANLDCAKYADAHRTYSHVAKVGRHITIGGTAGFNPATGELAGPDVQAQTRQILQSFKIMLASVGSDLDHVVHKTSSSRTCGILSP
jgi:enamine deaminase RidA (YjgF/YER057c/UK114 family)